LGRTGFKPVEVGQWLANNNLLVWKPHLPDKECRAMLSADQINDLHRLYWSEHWSIRKIERLQDELAHDPEVSGSAGANAR
jgi:hypothetical protein